MILEITERYTRSLQLGVIVGTREARGEYEGSLSQDTQGEGGGQDFEIALITFRIYMSSLGM